MKNEVGTAIYDYALEYIGNQDDTSKIVGMMIELTPDQIREYVSSYKVFRNRLDEGRALLSANFTSKADQMEMIERSIAERELTEKSLMELDKISSTGDDGRIQSQNLKETVEWVAKKQEGKKTFGQKDKIHTHSSFLNNSTGNTEEKDFREQITGNNYPIGCLEAQHDFTTNSREDLPRELLQKTFKS